MLHPQYPTSNAGAVVRVTLSLDSTRGWTCWHGLRVGRSYTQLPPSFVTLPALQHGAGLRVDTWRGDSGVAGGWLAADPGRNPLLEQISMRAGTLESDLVVHQLVDEQPIGFDVAFAPTAVVAD